MVKIIPPRYNPIKTSNPFDYISPEGKSLVEKLIQLDPDSRFSANEVLNCDWLNEFDYEEVSRVILILIITFSLYAG